MCDPITAVTAASMAISAGSAITQASAQGQQAKAENAQAAATATANAQTNANNLAQAQATADAQAKINAEERQRAGTQTVAANENFSQSDAEIQRENSMLSAETSETSLSLAVQQAQRFGKIANSSSAAGIGSPTSHAFFNASAAGYNRAMGISDVNAGNRRAGLQSDYVGADITRQSAINNISPETIFAPVYKPTALPTSYGINPGPSALSTGLNVAGALIQGASTYKSLGGSFGIKPASSAI